MTPDLAPPLAHARLTHIQIHYPAAGSSHPHRAAELDLLLETFSPAGRHTCLKCLAACAASRPTNGKYTRRTRTADVEAAYLQGELEGNVIYMLGRPPDTARTIGAACPSCGS